MGERVFIGKGTGQIKKEEEKILLKIKNKYFKYFLWKKVTI